MSAYGEIKRAQSTEALPSTFWLSSARTYDADGYISVYHLTFSTARALPGLIEYLHTVFAREIEDGMTYPQEGEMLQATFDAYFFAADVFIGVVGVTTRTGITDAGEQTSTLEDERAGRTWEDAVAGYYYVRAGNFRS